jgi:hypothetical protein
MSTDTVESRLRRPSVWVRHEAYAATEPAGYVRDSAPFEAADLLGMRDREIVALKAAAREAGTLIDLIAAEFKSDPMSVQCFDLRIVERVKRCADTVQVLLRDGSAM